MAPELSLVGVPSSAGSHHAGQDLAPDALRRHGLVDRLVAVGVGVTDTGDVEGSVWVPDRPDARARNLDTVVAVADRVADAVERAAGSGRIPLVLGGDCTITLGVVAGLQRAGAEVAVAYVDGDADLNSPERTRSGVLDATGVAHLLDNQADNALSRLGPSYPMLTERHIALLGYDPDDVDSVDTGFLADRPDLLHVTYRDLASDPVGIATRARESLESAGDGLVVHFDVDVVDGRELALANFPHYGTGIGVDDARRVLTVLLGSPQLAAIVLTEVNPTHDPTGGLLDRYVDLVVGAFADAGS